MHVTTVYMLYTVYIYTVYMLYRFRLNNHEIVKFIHSIMGLKSVISNNACSRFFAPRTYIIYSHKGLIIVNEWKGCKSIASAIMKLRSYSQKISVAYVTQYTHITHASGPPPPLYVFKRGFTVWTGLSSRSRLDGY